MRKCEAIEAIWFPKKKAGNPESMFPYIAL